MNKLDTNSLNILREYPQEIFLAYIWLNDSLWNNILLEAGNTDNYNSVENYERNILPELIRDISQNELYIRNEDTQERRIDQIIRDNITSFKARFIEISSAMYTSYNNSFLEQSPINREDLLYTSKLLPLIIVKTKREGIDQLVEFDQVQSINVIQNDIFFNEIEDVSQQCALSALKNPSCYATYGIKGRNVKIGIIEAKNTKINTIINHSKVVEYEIAGKKIIENGLSYEGVVPLSKIETEIIYKELDFIKTIENLILKKIYIINMSAGIEKENYSPLDKQVDQLIYKYKITFVKSAGNEETITAPGNSVNSIVVGNVESKEILGNNVVTKLYNYCMRKHSGYKQNSLLFNKPELVHPALIFIFQALQSQAR